MEGRGDQRDEWRDGVPRALGEGAEEGRDGAAMRRAFACAQRARRRSAPNPWVGAVVVAPDGEVAGEGATGEPGAAHAEVQALRAAGDRARGATLYVTLEPCPHHGRTPPCTDAILAAGVGRVVVALEDPDRRVAGDGVRRLRAAGVAVDVGVGAGEGEAILAPYLVHRREGRAATVVKVATSLDGRAAARDGSSRWITGPVARADAHALRADSQAVVVGAGTALADRPALTVRDVTCAPLRPPLRVVLDAAGRVPPEGPLFDPALAPTLVVTTAAAPAAACRAWRQAGADVSVVAGDQDGRGVDVRAALTLLGERGVLQALVEGGPTLAASLVAAGLVDRLVTYLAPVYLGRDGWPSVALAGPPTLADAERFVLVGVRRLGEDVRLDHVPAHRDPRRDDPGAA